MDIDVINLIKNNLDIKITLLFTLTMTMLIPPHIESVTFEELRARAQKAAKRRSTSQIQSKMRERLLHSKTYRAPANMGKDMRSKAYTVALMKAKSGDPNAQFALAGMYYQGIMIKRNYKKAIEWYKKAAKQGHTKAQFNLAYMYFDGRGVEKNHDKALKWFLEAGEHRDGKAELYLGIIYDEKGDDKNAFHWYNEAAKEGYPKAQYKLAHLYHHGKGCKKDIRKYIYYLKKAAAQSEAHAQYDLGIAYLKGDGVEKSKDKAYLWLQKAYLNGEPKAKEVLVKLKRNKQ